MICQKCGAQNRDGAGFCKRCGTVFRESAVSRTAQSAAPAAHCPACRRALRPGAAFCKYCGVRFSEAAEKAGPGKDPWLGLRIVLAILCVGMLVFGMLTIPDKIKARRNGAAEPQSQSVDPTQPAVQDGQSGQTEPGLPPKMPSPEELAAQYAEIDAMAERGELELPEPQRHEAYDWFQEGDAGWIEATESREETP